MFGRQKNPVTTSPAPEDETAAGIVEDDRKGRPTPKRKQAEAANRRPLVPANRQDARKAAKQADRAQRDKEYRALQTGDEKNMPYRDRGPVRRYVRDYVDARFNLGEFFLPLAAVCLVLQLAFARINAWISVGALFLLYFYVIAAIIDGVMLWRKLRRRITVKWGEVPRGTLMYAITRAFQLRRSRLPRPQIKRRAYPE